MFGTDLTETTEDILMLTVDVVMLSTVDDTTRVLTSAMLKHRGHEQNATLEDVWNAEMLTLREQEITVWLVTLRQ